MQEVCDILKNHPTLQHSQLNLIIGSLLFSSLLLREDQKVKKKRDMIQVLTITHTPCFRQARASLTISAG